uniref:Uncharacterized protein n=1 Tax=Manihot esculenta TaxID=3983 RepID=A0A2C9V7R3_MANES
MPNLEAQLYSFPNTHFMVLAKGALDYFTNSLIKGSHFKITTRQGAISKCL